MIQTILTVSEYCAAFGGGTLFYHGFGRRHMVPRPNPAAGPKPIWKVVVCSATTHNDDYYGHGGHFGGAPSEKSLVVGETAVRLVKGKQMHPIGTVKVSSDKFDDELKALVAKAEDRASTLNAYEDGML